jgi:hypothetical protein
LVVLRVVAMWTETAKTKPVIVVIVVAVVRLRVLKANSSKVGRDS